MIVVGENGPALDGWRLPSREPIAPPPRCCGTFATGASCGVCGNWISLDPLGSE